MHHTKVKADIAVAKVIADLTLKMYVPCLPLSEHQSYDLVVISPKGKAIKLQVKYSSLKENGTIDVRFRTSWSDKNGSHMTHYKEHDFDYYAIYCAQKDVVLYVPNKAPCPKAIRFDKPANNQAKSIKWANCYTKLK